MTHETTSAATARAIFEAAARRDPEGMAELYGDDVAVEWLPVGRFDGKQAVIEFWKGIFDSVPDSQLDMTNFISEGDHAVIQWRWHGTFDGGPYVGFHATGRHVDLRGCDVMRIEDGLLADEIIYMDGLGWARQIGFLPGDGTAAEKALKAAFNAGTDLKAAIHEWWAKRRTA
ncbi:MAG: ester cyclase [Actinomycetota bacterium]